MLRITGAVTFPGVDKFFFTDHTGNKAPYTEAQLRSSWAREFPHLLDVTLQTYICALTIALPGGVRTSSNVWFVDGALHPFSSKYLSQVHEAVEFLVENGMLPSSDIDPEETVSWVFSQKGIFDGYSDTPAARALSFFTRLFVREFRNDELSDLVWALAGIE